MAESKDTKDQGQEEYQYSGEEFGITEDVEPQEFQAPKEGSAGLPGILGRKFVVPGLVIVVTLILYLWMTLTSKHTEEPKDIGGAGAIKAKLSHKLPPEAAAPPVAPAHEVHQAHEAPKEVTLTQPTESMTPVMPEQTAAATPSEPPVEAAKINELNASVSQLQATVGDLGKEMVTISAKLDQIEKIAQKPVEEKLGPKHKGSRNHPRITAPTVLPMVYEVKAVVPGRAWIQSENGELTSIEVGETLVGYGKVESIDVTEGIVKLSSGATIQYGLYDR